MPYRVRGKSVQHLKNGRWITKQKCSSHDNAIKAMRLLYMVEAGGKPTGKPSIMK